MKVAIAVLFETSAVATLLTGDFTMTRELSTRLLGAVALPQPVIADVTSRLAGLDELRWPDVAILRRWRSVEVLFARCAWTDGVTAALVELRRDLAAAVPGRGECPATELDVAVAAHALAHGAEVVVGSAAAAARMAVIQGVSGLRVQHWGREADRGRYPAPT